MSDVKEPMSLGRISTSLKRTKSEIYRVISALEQKGYLSRSKSGDAFYITNKLFNLGMKVPPTGTLVEATFPVLYKLSAQIKQSCHIAVASEQHFVVIARVQSPANVGLLVRVGHHLELHKSGSGMVLLSYMPKEVREELLSLFAKTDTDFNRNECESIIEKILSTGHRRSKSPIISGLVDLSFPIFLGNSKDVVACITVPFIVEKGISLLGITETESFIRTAASELSELAKTYSGF